MPIRVIIETLSTLTDRNGNRYHAARVTSLEGKSLMVSHVGGDRNIPIMFSRMGLGHSEIHETQTTLGYRKLVAVSKGQPMEHQLKGAMWHMLPLGVATGALSAWLAEKCVHIEKSVVAENDGSLPESYRLSMERHGEACREAIASVCADHGIQVSYPGIFPCFSIAGRDWTARRYNCDIMCLAAAILAQPCKFAP